MIKLRGKTGEENINNKIVFEPRPGFVRGNGAAPSLDYPLIYGHRCPYCSNVMTALFKAPKAIDLWPYEETVLLSQGEKNSGEIRKTYPDDKTRRGESCYRVEFNAAGGGSVKLTLKNHILRHCTLSTREFNGEGLWEKGERPCIKTGVFSLREDLLVKDFLLFSQLNEHEIPKYNIPKVNQLITETNSHFKAVSAVGIAPPVILVERQALVYGFHYHTRPLMAAFLKGAK